MSTLIETKATQVNMLHRQTLAFAWQLQLLNNTHPINLSNEKFEFKIIDRRGNILITATIGNGLLLSNDLLSIIFDIPVSTLDALLTANKYVLNRIVGAQIIPVIQGSFNVVDTFHNASLKAHIQGNATLIQTSMQQGQIIQITGCQFINTGSGGNSNWGNITGNIQNQIDLINYFNQYYPVNNPANFQDAGQVQTEIANSLIPFSTIAYADAREAAAKAYADQLVVGLLDDRGNYDASVNTYPITGGSGAGGAIKKGDLWTVSVSGTLAGLKVTPGDLVRALIDNPGQINSNWAVSETNIGYTAEDQFNKSTSITTDQGSNQKYPSVKAVFDWATSAFVTATSVASQIASALVGYATQSWVNSQGFISSVTGALGYTPENAANKAISLTSPDNTKYPTTQAVADGLATKAPTNLVGTPMDLQFAVSDETTALTTGTKITFRMPRAYSLTSVRGSLTTAQSSGSLLTVDVRVNGTSVFSTLLTFDNNEKTTTTAATASILTSNPLAIADDAEITVVITQVGTGGAGLKLTLKGNRA